MTPSEVRLAIKGATDEHALLQEHGEFLDMACQVVEADINIGRSVTGEEQGIWAEHCSKLITRIVESGYDVNAD